MYLDRQTYNNLYNKALSLGASDFGYSQTKNKRFFVIFQNQKINFGAKTGSTFIDHEDEYKRNAWRKRHSKIMIGNIPAYKVKTSPEFWNWNLTWS